jgi:hypothetical protein
VKLAPSNPQDRFGRLLAIIAATFIISGADQPWVVPVTAVMNLVLVIVAFRTTRMRTSMPFVSALALVALAAIVLAFLSDNGTNASAFAAFAQFALLLVLVIAVMRSILMHEQVTIQTILGAIAAYALIGMMFSYLYYGMDSFSPGQFSMSASTPSAYPEFSFVVLTTLGFGNQLPTASFASRLTVSEAMIGQIFLATFIARLVTLYPRAVAPEAAADQD